MEEYKIDFIIELIRNETTISEQEHIIKEIEDLE